MRVTYNGYTYESAGDAVREQIRSIDNDILSKISVGGTNLISGTTNGYWHSTANGILEKMNIRVRTLPVILFLLQM